MTDPQQPWRPPAGAGLPPVAPFGSAPGGPERTPDPGPGTPAPDPAPPLRPEPGRVPPPAQEPGDVPPSGGTGSWGSDDSDDTQPVPRVPDADQSHHDTQELPVVPAPAPAATPPAAPAGARRDFDPGRATRARRSRRRGLLAVGIIVLALVLGVLGWRLVQAQRFEQRLASDSEAARQVVQTYYTALRDGDAEAALGTAALRPEETSLLSDEVLRSAQEAGGIQNLNVGEAALANDSAARIVGDAGTVAVTYAIGSTPVDIDLPVTRDGGTWRISAATSRVDLGGKGVPRTVNGHPAGADVVELFPGTYTVGTASKAITLAQPRLLVTAPDPLGAAAQTWTGGGATLAADTRAAVLAAARASLTSCLAQRSLAPKGCPISIETGPEIQIEESTIRYQLLNDPWSKTEVQLGDDGRATGKVDLEYRIEASAKSKGVEGVVRQTYTQPAVTFSADLGGDKPVITWQ